MKEQEPDLANDAEALEDSWSPDDLNVSDHLLDAAMEQISGLEDGARSQLRKELSQIGSSYLLEKFASAYDANPKKTEGGNHSAHLQIRPRP